jgi:hypothetical protein
MSLEAFDLTRATGLSGIYRKGMGQSSGLAGFRHVRLQACRLQICLPCLMRHIAGLQFQLDRSIFVPHGTPVMRLADGLNSDHKMNPRLTDDSPHDNTPLFRIACFHDATCVIVHEDSQ